MKTPAPWLPALAAAALVLSGCSGAADEPGQAGSPGFANGYVIEPDDTGEPVRGGTLDFVTYSEARSLDPTVTIANGSSGGTEMAAVYDLLVRHDPATGEYVPQLAESLESDDDQTWTLTLRDGVTFSDGTPLDAAAVVWSLDRYVSEAGPQVTFFSRMVKSYEAKGDDTVVFQLNQPWSDFGYLLSTGPGMVVGKAAVKGKTFEPVGAGPYVQDHYSPDEELVLTARKDYWAGEPAVESVRFFSVPVEQSRLDSLTNDEVDLAFLREAATAEDALAEGFGGFMEIGSVSRGLLLNHREGSATADVRVRQALVHAIDLDVVNERTAEGVGIMSAGILNEHSRFETDAEPLAYDPERAKALLEEAKADGYDGRISFKGVAQVSEASGVTLKALLEAVGFEVSLDYVGSVSDLMADIYVKNDYDMVIWGFGMPDDAVFPELYEKVHSESRSNTGGSKDTEMDGLLDDLGAATDDAGREKALSAIQERWNETVPYVSLGATPEWVAWDDDVHGVVPSIDTIMLLGGAWKE